MCGPQKLSAFEKLESQKEIPSTCRESHTVNRSAVLPDASVQLHVNVIWLPTSNEKKIRKKTVSRLTVQGAFPYQ